jgi:exosome complex component RRP41
VAISSRTDDCEEYYGSSILSVGQQGYLFICTQASRVEILNDGGFRSDGRRQYELREITIDLAQQSEADGSAVLAHGLTQVAVSVFGPREAKVRSQTIHDRANINVEVNIATFSAGERRKRSRGDR